MKKALSVLIVISMSFSLFLAVNVFSARETVNINGITYGSYDTYSAVENCDKNKGGIISIPSSVDINGKNLPVTRITDKAFSECRSISEVVMPEGVTDIGEGAFKSCTGISSVKIPKNVTSIVYATFDGCTSLKNVTVPKSVTSIKSYAFNNCSSIEKAYYFGTAEEWNKVYVREGNEQLTSHLIYHPEHSFGYDMVIKEATLTEEGISSRTCTVCGYKETFNTKKLSDRNYGDINGDGEVNNKDVVEIFRYVSSIYKVQDESLYDYNKDTEVNNRDVVALFRRVSTLQKE